MIVHNRKRENATVLCDLVGCGRAEKLRVSAWVRGDTTWGSKANPKLKTWLCLGALDSAAALQAQAFVETPPLHFCDEHAPVLLDVIFERVQIAAGAAETVRELVKKDRAS